MFRKDLNSFIDHKKEGCDVPSHYEIKFLIEHFYWKLNKQLSNQNVIITEDFSATDVLVFLLLHGVLHFKLILIWKNIYLCRL